MNGHVLSRSACLKRANSGRPDKDANDTELYSPAVDGLPASPHDAGAAFTGSVS